MPFELFKSKVNALIERAGTSGARFSQDTEHGKYFANCSGGIQIIGNAECKKVMVKYHNGRQSIVEI